MNCIDFELAVQDRLDARRTELTPELQSHHDLCGDCRAFHAAQVVLVSVVEEWRSTSAPSAIMDAALIDLAVPLAKRQPARAANSLSRGRVYAALCSAAAMVVLAVTLLRAPPIKQQSVAINQSASPADESAFVSDALTGLLHGMDADYAALPAQTQRALQQISELPDSTALLQDVPEPERPAIDPPMEWQRWSRPVSDRVGQAFGFLWEALPQSSERSS